MAQKNNRRNIMKRIPDIDDFIFEKKIGELLDDIKIEIDLDTTKHAEERKTRHGEENPITNDDIILTTSKALDEIGTRQLKGIDKIGRKYWIYDESNKNLNVIAVYTRSKNDLKLVIVTVMREKDFHGSSDAWKINV